VEQRNRSPILTISADSRACSVGHSPPDLPISHVLQGESESKIFLLEIVPIDSDSVVDELTFFLIEEGSFLREVGYEDESKNSGGEGEDSHQDLIVSSAPQELRRTYEDPRPSSQSTCWGNLARLSAIALGNMGGDSRETPSDDVSESTNELTAKVERTDSFLSFVSWVPT
jgi:hypothetical protein